MKISAVILALLPLTLAAPIATQVDARQGVTTDGETIVLVVEYNADLIQRDAKAGTIPPIEFPPDYSRDLIERDVKREASGEGIPPLTGFPSRYGADLIEEE